MDPKVYQFCEACAMRRERAKRAGLKKLPQLALATDSLLVHDGSREFISHLCDHCSGGALTAAVEEWGHSARDRVIAFPARVH